MGELKFEDIDLNTQKLPTIVTLDYSDPQQEIMETTAQRVLFLGGVGIGKSQTAGTIAIELVLNNPEVRGFIGANTYGQLTKSTLDRIKNVWEKQFNLVKGLQYVEGVQPPKHFKRFGADLSSYEHTISFSNGAMIFTASLENRLCCAIPKKVNVFFRYKSGINFLKYFFRVHKGVEKYLHNVKVIKKSRHVPA